MNEIPPCKVCGGTDLNLVDGFYYCTECGTQDATIRETIIEYQVREDGTFAHKQIKKILLPVDKKDLSPEWYKWHAYNFMMAGFADELVDLGAGDEFKLRLLWIWSKYIRAYRRDDKSIGDDAASNPGECIPDSNEPADPELLKPDVIRGTDRLKRYRVHRIMMSVMQAMLYAALNASESEIQVGDLRRFIREERVSCRNCMRFIPDELNFRKMNTNDRCLITASELCSTEVLRGYTMTLFKNLNLGLPPEANLRKLASRYMTELCLPVDFKDLVFLLMDFMPVDLEMEFLEDIPRTPNYEGVAMAYVVIGLKICFGLDGTHENVLSDAVTKYNEVNGLAKAVRDGAFIDSTDRLFSFTEWSIHMEFKKQIISKYYFPVAVQLDADLDSQVFISYTNNRVRKNDSALDVGDDIMMKILERINADVETFKTPKMVFPPSLTPIATYTDVLLSKLDDPELKEMLGEDFTQYSLSYVMGNMELNGVETSGISPKNYAISDETMKNRIKGWEVDRRVVYVRNCENDNWLVTKPPTEEHVKICDNDVDDVLNEDLIRSLCKSAVEDLPNEIENESKIINDSKSENIEMNDEIQNVFDDDFDVPDNELWASWQNEHIQELEDLQINDENRTQINYELIDGTPNIQIEESTFDPETFDREAAIEKLMEIAKKEYRINEASTKTSYKRKLVNPADGPKRKRQRKEPQNPNRTKPGDAKKHVENIVNTYFITLFNRSQYGINTPPEINEIENEILPEIRRNEIDENIQEEPQNEISPVVPNNEIDENIQEEQQNAISPAVLNNEIDENIQEEPHNNTNIEDKEKENDTDDEDSEKVEDDLENNPEKKLFDEHIYDTKQLYLKTNNIIEPTVEVNSDVKDSEIIELFRQKEKELESEMSDLNQEIEDASLDDTVRNSNIRNANKVDTVNNDIGNVCDSSGSDETESNNIPLSEVLNELRSENSTNTFLNKDTFRPYNYWMLHYFRGYPPDSFEKELNRRYSKSFAWTLRLCASVIESSTRVLYLQVMNLEKELKKALRSGPVSTVI